MIVAMVSPALRLKTLLAPSAILGTAAVLAIRVRLPMLLLVLGDLAFPVVLGRGQGQREYHRYPLVEVRTVVDSAVAKDGLQELKATCDRAKDPRFASTVAFGCVNSETGSRLRKRQVITKKDLMHLFYSLHYYPRILHLSAPSLCPSTCRLYKHRCYGYKHAMQFPINAQMRRDASPRCMTIEVV